MVAEPEAYADARLFSCRGRYGPPLLAFPRRALRARAIRTALVRAWAVRMTAYAEIAVTSNFSFLRGASRPEELIAQACLHGYAAIGIADRNTLAGVVRAYAGF